jgi:type IV secretion system protein VirB9
MTSFILLSPITALALGLVMPALPGDQAPPPPHIKELGSRSQRSVGIATALATIEPSVPAFVNATAVFAWNDGVVYHAYTAPGRVTDIILQPGEVLGSVASGDTARWIIGDTTSGSGADKRAHVLVKPFSAGLTTNLVITTDRRTYHVLLTSGSANAMAALSWSYPADEMIALKRAEDAKVAAAPVAAGLDIDALRFDYAISGDRPAWRPLRVFDDGRQTFIEFPATLGVGEAPPLFSVTAKGDAELVNYRVRGHFYIVDRLLDTAELRLGTRKQVIVRIARLAPAPGRKGRK